MEPIVRPSTLFVALTLILTTLPLHAAPKAELWSFWDVHDDTNTATMDHSVWQSVLSEYVNTHEDQVNRINYSGLIEGQGRVSLQRYIEQQTSLDPRRYNRQEQMAYWINLYNALTVEVVLGYPHKASILRMGKKFFSIGPWNDKIANVAGQKVSLNDIEHRILRPIWQDHRIHFAVNCASIGCPNLTQEVYLAENIDAALSAAEQQYINHSRGVSFNQRGQLHISSIFDWYQSDFADSDKALLTYLSKHHDTLSNRLRDYDKSIDYDYNWDLNSQNPR